MSSADKADLLDSSEKEKAVFLCNTWDDHTKEIMVLFSSSEMIICISIQE